MLEKDRALVCEFQLARTNGTQLIVRETKRSALPTQGADAGMGNREIQVRRRMCGSGSHRGVRGIGWIRAVRALTEGAKKQSAVVEIGSRTIRIPP